MGPSVLSFIFREAVLSMEFKNALLVELESEHLEGKSVSFTERFYLVCRLIGVSFIRGSNVGE